MTPGGQKLRGAVYVLLVTVFTWDGSFNIHIEEGWFLEK